MVIQAVEKSTEIAPFRIFFKDNRELPVVQKVFTDMAVGERVKKDSGSHTLQSAPPEFFCAKSTDFTARYWDECRSNDYNALTFDDQPYILLCPGFWEDLYPILEDENHNTGNDSSKMAEPPACPSFAIDAPGSFSSLPDNDWLVENKLAIMIHELSHLYTVNQVVPERYAMRDCAGLTSTKAAHNANNYAFYAMSECATLF